MITTTIMITITATTTIIMTEVAALYRLMTWLSPAYPTGGFSYSHGLEYAVEAGMVTTGDALFDWIETTLADGPGLIDGALLAAAWRAVAADDEVALDEVIEIAACWRGTSETALEAFQPGAAFLSTSRSAWPDPWLDRLAGLLAGRPLAHAVAVGVAAAASGVPLAAALVAYLEAFAANLVSAGVRLVPLGQTAGQIAQARLLPVVLAAAGRAETTPLDEIGSAALGVELASMRHETQYTRLFRS